MKTHSSISEPRNVHLLFDVLKITPPDIEPAVLFATRNVLVCETPEDAMHLAYERGSDCNDAVSLDGSMYQRSGIMSGGTRDLERRARAWDKTHLAQLKTRKETLLEDLQLNQRTAGRESELNNLNSGISWLERQLNHSDREKHSLLQEAQQLEAEQESLMAQLAAVQVNIAKLQEEKCTREKHMLDIKRSIAGVEDEVFADFCRQTGIDNIRRYEECDLRTYKEQMQQQLELEQLRERICQQLELIKTSDTSTNIKRWEKGVRDNEKVLETSKETEKIEIARMKRISQELDRLKSEQHNKKVEVDALEEDINKGRKELQDMHQRVNKVQHDVLALEEKLAHKQDSRRSLLRECKVQGHAVLLRNGSLSDLTGGASSSELSSADRSRDSQVEPDQRVSVDYSRLSNELKELDLPQKKVEHQLRDKIAHIQAQIESVKAPDMKASDKCERLTDELKQCDTKLTAARQRVKAATSKFKKIKEQRHMLFMQCFEEMNSHIDEIYKDLNASQLASATLNVNEIEPYDSGINYFCIAPGKRSLPMSGLSGGERVLASIAMLFAMNSYKPAPFIVLDEMDCALDNSNISKVVAYIQRHATHLQTILISHKEEMFAHSDVVLGISPDDTDYNELASVVTSLDLTLYQ